MSTTTDTTSLPNILLIGATGRTGRLVLESALTRGYKVTALIRPSSALPSHPSLTISKGSPLETGDITTALATINGPVVLISTLGQTRTSGNPFAATTSPPLFMLKGDTALSVKMLGDAGEKSGFMPSVSAKSVAEFILDATVSQEWDGRTPVLAN